jgi:hypothetical protein
MVSNVFINSIDIKDDILKNPTDSVSCRLVNCQSYRLGRYPGIVVFFILNGKQSKTPPTVLASSPEGVNLLQKPQKL